MDTISTPRTLIRPWRPEDAADLFPVFSDKEAMRFWNVPPATSADSVRSMIERSLSASADHHKGFAIVLKETECAIGLVNYHHREIANQRLEIGFIIARRYQRAGLAMEAVSAFVAFCFTALLANRVEALTDPANLASRALLERLGFQLEGGPLRRRLVLGDGRFGDQLVYAKFANEL